MLYYGSFALFFFGLTWLPEFCDFITILITKNNIDNSSGYLGFFGFFWIPFLILMGIIMGTEILELKNKKIVRTTFIILGIIFEFFLIFDLSNVIIYNNPSYPGERVIFYTFAEDHPLYYISLVNFLAIIALCVIGMMINGFKAKGILRKKYLLFSLYYFNISVLAFLATVISHDILLITINFLIIASFPLLYFALREEPIKREKIENKKEIKVEAGIFRLSKRPENITEEEVTISKEKKICLVCKGKVLGISFICPKCESFYCINCSETLSNLENSCWFCNNPFDNSKPSMPYLKKEEDLKLKITGEEKMGSKFPK